MFDVPPAEDRGWTQAGGTTAMTDIYAELYLWNKNIDSLIRVLQRMEGLRALPG